jgi:hypothetical protein
MYQQINKLTAKTDINMEKFTEVSERSWLTRIMASIKGILVGALLFLLAFPLLIWNESRSVERIKTLEEGLESVVHIEEAIVNTLINRIMGN